MLCAHDSSEVFSLQSDIKTRRMSAHDQSLQEPLTPAFPVGQGEESEKTRSIIRTLGLQTHPEGGYYKETDRDILTIPNPFQGKQTEAGSDSTRSASTTIYYMITPKRHVYLDIRYHHILTMFLVHKDTFIATSDAQCIRYILGVAAM